MIQYKYIAEYKKEEIDNLNVISCINQAGFNTILIKNSLKKSVVTTLNTDNLSVKLNSQLLLDNENYYFHIISSKNNDYINKTKFDVIYEYIFSKMTSPVTDTELAVLINSLEELFKITPEKDTFKMQVGVFGELLVIKELYKNGYIKILEKYHKNFYSKHDIEISRNIRIEIKTTSKETRIHNFGHLQIHRNDINVYVTSSKLEIVQEGFSLYEMFEYILNLYLDPDSIFELKKLMIKCNVNQDNHGLKFNLQKAEMDLKFYCSKDLPQLDINEVNGVSKIHYDVDLELANSIEITNLIDIFENN